MLLSDRMAVEEFSNLTATSQLSLIVEKGLLMGGSRVVKSTSPRVDMHDIFHQGITK